MKICIYLSLTLALGTSALVAADRDVPFRTDINPAMIYYQASLLWPDSWSGDDNFLYTNNWQGQHLPERFGAIVTGYDKEMTYLDHAAAQKVPCDWGIDMSPGPETLLPELAWCKKAAIMSRLHAMWELQQGNEDAAVRDILAGLDLGRNTSRDGSLIAMLVQIAIENIMCSTVAENFGHFSPDALKKLEDGFNAGPDRGTVASSFIMERFTYGHWLRTHIEDIENAHPGDDAAVMNDLQKLIERIGFEDQTNYWHNLTNATGGTVDGLVKMTQQSELFAEQLSYIVALPHGEFEDKFNQFSNTVEQSSNYLTISGLSAWPNSRKKEFAVQAELAMIQAAIEYKLHGDDGLKTVKDPFGTGPFTCERFVFQGEDRGFSLKSAYVPRAVPVTMIFVEKDGPPFLVNGDHAGQPAPK